MRSGRIISCFMSWRILNQVMHITRTPFTHKQKVFMEFICGISANKITTRWFWPKHCDLCTSCTSPVSRYWAIPGYGKDSCSTSQSQKFVKQTSSKKLLFHDLSKRCSKNQKTYLKYNPPKKTTPRKGSSTCYVLIGECHTISANNPGHRRFAPLLIWPEKP